MDMDESVWSQVPVEFVERVLSFSSVPDLCRFRAVCKRWNELVCKPSFHDLCDDNNKRGTRNHHVYLFVTRHWARGGTLMGASTSFLDVDAMRWYNSNPIKVDGRRFSMMDDGLMCELDASFQEFVISYAVANRARTRVLPKPPVPFSQPTIAMAVDPLSRSFKVVVIDNGNSTVQATSPQSMFMYESSSNQWRALRNPPEVGFAWSAIIFRQVLYIAFRREYQGQPLVWRYDLAEDVWGDVIEVTVPGKLKRPSQFVVSSDRLFLWMGVSTPNSELVLEVRETLLNGGTSRTVAQIAFSDLKHMFDEFREDFHVAYCAPHVNSEGLCKSITFVSSLSGKILCYDLVSRSVDVFPAFKEEVEDDDDSDAGIPPMLFYHGKPMKLSLRILTSQELG